MDLSVTNHALEIVDLYRDVNITQSITSANSCITQQTDLSEPDNTEGIGAFMDLEFPTETRLVIDVGGGRYDLTKEWLQKHYPFQVEIIDPFNRSLEHNNFVVNMVLARKGADVITSMSVLNVIPELENRLQHIRFVWGLLRNGGMVFFKVWAGAWPLRGSGEAYIDVTKSVYQANKWASGFYDEVVFIFGKSNVFVKDENNLIVAFKP
jgi:hypothetical protein